MRFKTRTLSPWAALLLSASLLLSLPFSLAEPVAPEAEVVLTDTQLAQPDVPPVQPEAAPQPAQPMVEPGLFFSLSIADCYTKLSPDELTAIISAVTIGAFMQWRRDYERWLAAAQENPGVMLAYVSDEG